MVVKGKNSFAFQLNSYSQWRCNHKYCCHIITALKSDWSGLWSTLPPLAENLLIMIRDNCYLAWGTPTSRSLLRLIVIMDIQLHEWVGVISRSFVLFSDVGRQTEISSQITWPKWAARPTTVLQTHGQLSKSITAKTSNWDSTIPNGYLTNKTFLRIFCDATDLGFYWSAPRTQIRLRESSTLFCI